MNLFNECYENYYLMISKKFIFFVFLFFVSFNIYQKIYKEKEISFDNKIEIIIPTTIIEKSINETKEKEKKKLAIQKIKELEKMEKNFLKLKDKPVNSNDPLIIKQKNEILLNYFNRTNINFDINIYYNLHLSFGNQLIGINNLIFICEIIRCKKIILPQDNGIYFQNKVHDDKYNLDIELEKDTYQDKKHIYNLTDIDNDIYFHKLNFRMENRIGILREEILKNLPQFITDENDLYIHIRSSDIFMNNDPNYAPDYAQPPLCFYQKIIDNYKFNQIHIISQDNANPVIDQLINNNNNIIYEENYIDNDIANLINAYNIVGSISSFLTSIIKLNKNLKNLWEYDIYPISLKIPHLHHSLYNYKINYTIYRMIPSAEYKNKMLIWECSEEQIRMMTAENCTNNFIRIEPNK